MFKFLPLPQGHGEFLPVILLFLILKQLIPSVLKFVPKVYRVRDISFLKVRDVQKIIDILYEDKDVTAYRNSLTLFFGPDEVLVNLNVNFKDGLVGSFMK